MKYCLGYHQTTLQLKVKYKISNMGDYYQFSYSLILGALFQLLYIHVSK